MPLSGFIRISARDHFGSALALGSILILFSQVAAPLAAVPEKTNVVHYPPSADIPKMLAERGRQQIEAAKRIQTFHDFQFTDRTVESQISFEQSSVDDALKWWKGVHYDHGSGMTVADVDGDGRLDIYFVNQLGTNQLWRNLGSGRFENITARAGVALEGRIHVAASFADIDNDGDPDLFVTTVRGGNVLFENLGGGRFRDITERAGLGYVGHSSGAVFFDCDRDGLLDLFVTNVGIYTTEEKKKDGFYASLTNAFRGHMYPERTEFSILYRNLGQGKFRDVSREIGLREGSWSGDATFADLNEDGFPDLYVLNMQGDNHYYENISGTRFADKTASHFPKTPWGAMGIKFFDFDRDGRLDLFITDMHSDMAETQSRAGRTNLVSQFEKAKSDPWCTTYFDAAFLQGASNNVFGNALYLNKGNGAFEEVSDRTGAETYWPWGLSVGDLNADGYEDAFITAGMGYPFRYGINSLLLNDRGQRFFDAEFLVGVEPRAGGRFDKPMFSLDVATEDAAHDLALLHGPKVLVYGALSSRSSASFDLDDDGDLDIVTNEMNDRPMVLVSNLSERKPIHFLKVRLIGTVSNRDGLGATVNVHAGGTTFTQFHDGKSGYLAQSSIPLYFGLGNAAAVTSVEIRWPSGKRQNISENIPRNGTLTVREPRD